MYMFETVVIRRAVVFGVALASCLVALPGAIEAQYFFDNFDSYAAGSTIAGQGGWETWAGDPGADTVVVENISHSWPNSLELTGTADIVHQFAGLTSGTWYAKARVFVPSSQQGELFLIILNRYDDTAGYNWSVQLAMCQSGCANPGTATNLGGTDVAGTGSTALVTDQWVEIVVEINLDANQYSVWYNGVLLDTLPWTLTGDINIAAFDLFSNGSNQSYIDDVWLDTTRNGAGRGVAAGRIFDWLESGSNFDFDDFVGVVSNIGAWWSIGTFDPSPSGWFYDGGNSQGSEIAHVTTVQHISEVTDASVFAYEQDIVGLVNIGDFVFYRNQTTGFYAAFKVEEIRAPGGVTAVVDVTWYLQEDGSADFNSFVSFDDFESGDASAWSSQSNPSP